MLGSDCGEKYQNLYTINQWALNKLQHNEEKDKKRQLSHKFSINTTPDFKWTGSLYGRFEKKKLHPISVCSFVTVESELFINLNFKLFFYNDWELLNFLIQLRQWKVSRLHLNIFIILHVLYLIISLLFKQQQFCNNWTYL